MVDAGLLDRLHEMRVINKNYVLWWQLGFEGRRVFTEEEFSEGLESVSYHVHFDRKGSGVEPHEATFDIWVRDDVPILLRGIKITGEEVTSFVSVKPMSHERGWEDLRINKKHSLPLEFYHSPHVRGLVVEQTDDFLFWNPFTFGDDTPSYQTRAVKLEGLDLPVMVLPVHPKSFYRNLIEKRWNKGKRLQKRAERFDIEGEGYQLVPYHSFDFRENHLTIYPVPIFDGRLDLPGVIYGLNGKPAILGVGYADFDDNSIRFWKLDPGQQRKAKLSLMERLGDVSRR